MSLEKDFQAAVELAFREVTEKMAAVHRALDDLQQTAERLKIPLTIEIGQSYNGVILRPAHDRSFADDWERRYPGIDLVDIYNALEATFELDLSGWEQSQMC